MEMYEAVEYIDQRKGTLCIYLHIISILIYFMWCVAELFIIYWDLWCVAEFFIIYWN